jgi:hypothetical protein
MFPLNCSTGGKNDDQHSSRGAQFEDDFDLVGEAGELLLERPCRAVEVAKIVDVISAVSPWRAAMASLKLQRTNSEPLTINQHTSLEAEDPERPGVKPS